MHCAGVKTYLFVYVSKVCKHKNNITALTAAKRVSFSIPCVNSDMHKSIEIHIHIIWWWIHGHKQLTNIAKERERERQDGKEMERENCTKAYALILVHYICLRMTHRLVHETNPGVAFRRQEKHPRARQRPQNTQTLSTPSPLRLRSEHSHFHTNTTMFMYIYRHVICWTLVHTHDACIVYICWLRKVVVPQAFEYRANGSNPHNNINTITTPNNQKTILATSNSVWCDDKSWTLPHYTHPICDMRHIAERCVLATYTDISFNCWLKHAQIHSYNRTKEESVAADAPATDYNVIS